jgi:hypothetical protein
VPWLALPVGLTLAMAAGLANAQPTPDEMWKMIQKQQQQIEMLRQRLEGTNKKVEATATAVEKAGTGGGAPGWWQRTSLGGYGELHYNGGDADELDYHRFVLFFGHQFNDRLRLFSELELEHALAKDTSDGSGPGEVELEQAWLEYDVTDRMSARAGLSLIPVGILNETHEPPTFYGVERNRVESNIIPTTWWEGGAGLAYKFDNGLRLDAQVHGGLDVPTTGSNAFKVRNGRQKVAKSTLRDPAYTGRVRYTGIAGVELASTLQYQADMTQGDPGDPRTNALLWEAHVDMKRAISDRATLGLRALYARWDLGGSAAAATGRDEQYGWYVEPSVRFKTGHGDVGFFARYSQDDNTAGDNTDSDFREISVGMNYWVHPNAVLKFDYQFQTPPDGQGTTRDNRANLGLGYQF